MPDRGGPSRPADPAAGLDERSADVVHAVQRIAAAAEAMQDQVDQALHRGPMYLDHPTNGCPPRAFARHFRHFTDWLKDQFHVVELSGIQDDFVDALGPALTALAGLDSIVTEGLRRNSPLEAVLVELEGDSIIKSAMWPVFHPGTNTQHFEPDHEELFLQVKWPSDDGSGTSTYSGIFPSRQILDWLMCSPLRSPKSMRMCGQHIQSAVSRLRSVSTFLANNSRHDVADPRTGGRLSESILFLQTYQRRIEAGLETSAGDRHWPRQRPNQNIFFVSD